MIDGSRSQLETALEVATQIASADASQLPQLDEWARRVLAGPDWEVTPGWKEWAPLIRVHPELRLALACAPSGYVRAQGCRLLATYPSNRGLGLLLLRSNDWVLPVRAEARAALDVYDQPALAAWWIEHLPLVLRFGSAVRAPFPALFGRVQTLLSDPRAAEALQAGWRSPDVAVRRALLQLLRSDQMNAELQTLLIGDPDVRIRRALVPLIAPDALRALLRDPDGRVRSSALSRLLPTLIAAPEVEEIRRALLDTHNSVRLPVQYALQQADHDVRQLYLDLEDATLSPREQLGFLGGLADVGRPVDSERVVPYLNPPASVKQRVEALRTLAALDIGHAKPLLWNALSQGGQVARQAERSIKQHDLVTPPLLQAFWNEAQSDAPRKRAIHLALYLSRFEAVATLLEWRDTALHLSAQIDEHLERLLAGFGKTYFTHPETALRERIRAATSPSLPAQLVSLIDLL
ncbi:hypothetical protein [Deinococcus alpinitundrae]|uniref:hypothetical protein n=1 Tax=Deinococcus alpinitundrae TaxID=468913 RepID=UPI00137B3657|nr:hypothetical protein [Deinococcus alpinitundrae]